MNKILLATITVLFVTVSSFASTELIKENPIGIEQNEITLHLDLGDLSKMTDVELEDKLSEFFDNALPKNPGEELQCKVRVTGSVGIGSNKVEISVEVSGPCSEMIEAGEEIANLVLKKVKEALAR